MRSNETEQKVDEESRSKLMCGSAVDECVGSRSMV